MLPYFVAIDCTDESPGHSIMSRIYCYVVVKFFLLAASISGAAAQTDAEFRAMYGNGEPRLLKMEELARSGNVKAQTWYGLMLQNRSRFSEALYWYTLSAEVGQIFAIQQAAFLYERGLGTPRDIAKAMEWHRLGAELGDATSQMRYGSALLHGVGVQKDEAQGFRWYRAAADQKYRYASLGLAKLYDAGVGTERDPIAAYIYAEIAEYESRGSDKSGRDEAQALKERLRAELTPAQIERALERVYQERPLLSTVRERERQSARAREQLILFVERAALPILFVIVGGFAGRAVWRRWRRPGRPSPS